MKLLFLHGWGFEASIWEAVRAALAPMETVAWDRGYFGQPSQPGMEGPFAAVGHSLGSLLLAADPPPGCEGLIAINGFDRFTGEGRVAPRLLDRMRSRFATSPRDVLDDFRKRCGGAARTGEIDAARLAADLDSLATLNAIGRSKPFIVLHGNNDEILPPAMREAVFVDAHHKTKADAGHLLPLTHPQWCADRIREALA